MKEALSKKNKRQSKVIDVPDIPKDLIDLSTDNKVDETLDKPIQKKKKVSDVIDGSVYYKSKAELTNSIHENVFTQFTGYNRLDFPF